MKPVAQFLKMKCEKCHNEQVIFSRASTIVKCLVCGEVLAEPTGGSVRLKAKPVEIFENR
ncbi:MAG: 30S ribosomal protein S27e [Candidatus Aenigmatarchaeota archaeon]